MAYVPDQQINTGSFVPTTIIYDVARLYEVDVNSDEFKELLVILYQSVNNIAIALNTKYSALQINEEFADGSLWFNETSFKQEDLRAGFHINVITGPLNAGVTAVLHGLPVTADWKWMTIHGAATDTDTVTGVPLPFAGATGNNIEVSVTATHVVIDNQSGFTFTNSQVYLQYVKS